MDISSEKQGGTVTVLAGGRIDGSNARAFHDLLESSCDNDDRAMILDLSGLSYISSAGLRVILLMAKTLQRRRGRLVVCSLPASIKELFELSGFDKIVPVLASRDDAAAELQAS